MKVTWRGQVWWPILGICALHLPIQSAHTQQWTHIHCEHTPGAVGSHLCCGARGAVGGSVPCSRAPKSWYWGWRECCTFTPPPTIPAGPETRTRNLWDTSPTLQPLGHDFPRHLGSSWLRPTLQYSRWQQCTLLLDVERQKKRSSRLLYTCICCFRKKQYAFFMEFRILWPNLHNLRTDFWWGIVEKKHCPH